MRKTPSVVAPVVTAVQLTEAQFYKLQCALQAHELLQIKLRQEVAGAEGRLRAAFTEVGLATDRAYRLDRQTFTAVPVPVDVPTPPAVQ